MGFQNRPSVTPIFDKDEAIFQREEYLASLDKKIEAVEASLDTSRKEKVSLKNVDEKLAKAHKKLSETIEMEHEVLDRISVLRNEEKDILLNKENLLKEVEGFNNLLQIKSVLVHELEILNNNILDKKNELSSTVSKSTANINELTSQVNSLEKSKTTLEASLLTLENAIAQQNEILENKITNLKNLEISIQEKTILLADLSQKVNGLIGEKGKVEKSIIDSEEKFKNIEAEFNKKLEDRLLEIDKQEEVLAEREGELSVKQRWIEDKTKKLQLAKNQIEEKTGRRINIEI